MHRILPRKWLFIAFAWLVIGLVILAQSLPDLINLNLKLSSIPAFAWIGLNLLLINPVWRFIWRKCPRMNKWVFPDLNGVWDVELRSNWSRQEQLLNAATGATEPIDMRTCGEEMLAPLLPVHLRAQICQSWWSFEMRLWNPRGDTPIKDSQSISVDPFSRQGLKPPGICYFYKQENLTPDVSDDTEFFGAARLTYDFETNQLTGLVWTARKWPRAMNTAGPIVFTRHDPEHQ